MDHITQIKNQLNKDHHKNLFFTKKIPPAWEFPGVHIDHFAVKETTVNYNEINITYNNLGYRSDFNYAIDSLKNKDCILCLGDSDTFGRVIHLNDLWTTHISKLYPDYNVLNLGIPGAAADSVSRIGANTISALEGAVKIVLVLWPSYHRREFVNKDFIGAVYKTPDDKELVPFENYWDTIDWKSNSYNFYKNKQFIESVCSANNIKYYGLEINRDSPIIKNDFKNEYLSFGNDTQLAIANYFEERLRSI